MIKLLYKPAILIENYLSNLTKNCSVLKTILNIPMDTALELLKSSPEILENLHKNFKFPLFSLTF